MKKSIKISFIALISLLAAFAVIYTASFFSLCEKGGVDPFSVSFFSLFDKEFIDSLKDEEESPVDGEIIELFESLGIKGDDASYATLDDIEPSLVLLTSPLTQRFFQEYAVTYYGDHEKSEFIYSVVKLEPSKYHIRKFKNEELIQTVISNGENIQERDEYTGKVTNKRTSDDSYFEAYSSLPSVVDMVNFVVNYSNGDNPIGPYGKVDHADVKLIRVSDRNMAEISLKIGEREEHYVLDLDNGIFLSVSLSVSGQQYFSLTTAQYTLDLSGIDLVSLFG